jgi:hypothetical protein
MHAAVVHAFGAPPRYTLFADPVAGEREFFGQLHPVTF